MRTQKRYEDFPCFVEQDRKKLGRFALDSIADEFIAEKTDQDNYPFCVFCYMREIDSPYQLPCRHVIHDMGDEKLSIDNIHPRYFNQTSITLEEDNPIQIEHIEDDTPHTYTDLMAEISPFASIAPHNKTFMDIFMKTIDELHSAEKRLSNRNATNNRAKWTLSITSFTKCYLRRCRENKKKYPL